MQVLIAIIATVGSIIGFIGLFTTDFLFYLGGILSFCALILYGEAFIRNKDKAKRIEIADRATSKQNKDLLTKQNRRIQILSRIITVSIFFIIFVIFKQKGICWIGIVFGLLFIPELIKLMIKRAAK